MDDLHGRAYRPWGTSLIESSIIVHECFSFSWGDCWSNLLYWLWTSHLDELAIVVFYSIRNDTTNTRMTCGTYLEKLNRRDQSTIKKKKTRGALIYWPVMYVQGCVGRSPNLLDDPYGQGGNWWCYKKAPTPKLVHMARPLKDWLGRTKHMRWSSQAPLMTSFVFGQTRSHEKLVHPHNRLDGWALHEIWKK